MFHFVEIHSTSALDLNVHPSLIYTMERKSSLNVCAHVGNMIAFPAEEEEDTVISAVMCCVHASCHD